MNQGHTEAARLADLLDNEICFRSMAPAELRRAAAILRSLPRPWWDESVEMLQVAAEDAERMADWPDRAASHGDELRAKAAGYRRAIALLQASDP